MILHTYINIFVPVNLYEHISCLQKRKVDCRKMGTSLKRPNEKVTALLSLSVLFLSSCNSFSFNTNSVPYGVRKPVLFPSAYTSNRFPLSQPNKLMMWTPTHVKLSFHTKNKGSKLYASHFLSLKNNKNKNIVTNSLTWIRKRVIRIKQVTCILFAASLLFLGSASIHTSASHASSLATAKNSSPSTTLLVSSTTSSLSDGVDKIIENYVEKHMFDDEQYDPFESAYREAYGDQISGKNPVKDILDSEGLVVEETKAITKDMKDVSLWSKVKNFPRTLSDMGVNWAEKNTDLDPKLVRLFIAVSTVTILPSLLLYSVLSFGGIFRKGMMTQEVKRYGSNKE